jgi:hypothetical protein
VHVLFAKAATVPARPFRRLPFARRHRPFDRAAVRSVFVGLTDEHCSASVACIMRDLVVLLLVGVFRAVAFAACPGPACFAGDGSKATACLVAFSGMTSKTLSCADGSACDLDGKVDGVCTLDVQACINVRGMDPSCTPTGLDQPPTVKPASSPTAQQLAAALGALDAKASACTPPGLALPLKVSLGGIKADKTRLAVTATSGGKRDRVRLQLACEPAGVVPSFAQAVQPILSNRCAYAGCHDAATAHDGTSGNLVLDAGVARGNLVGVHATLGKLLRVKPGSLRGSEMARRILGQGYAKGGLPMPQGCPGITPLHGCLTDQERFTILAWIAGGAPDN